MKRRMFEYDARSTSMLNVESGTSRADRKVFSAMREYPSVFEPSSRRSFRARPSWTTATDAPMVRFSMTAAVLVTTTSLRLTAAGASWTSTRTESPVTRTARSTAW
jgi:hypothetical protein